MPRRSRPIDWVIGIAGVLAAAVGAWMYYVPTTWVLGGLAAGWHLAMFTGAGLLLAAAFGLFARRMLREDRVWTTQSITATIVAVLALAGAVFCGLVWIL